MKSLIKTARTRYLLSKQGIHKHRTYGFHVNYKLIPPPHVTSVNIWTSQVVIAGLKSAIFSRLHAGFASSRAFVVALENISMLVNLVFFTKCGGLATATGAAEIADHASI